MLDYCLVAIPLFSLAIYVVVQLLVARLCPRWGYLKFIAAGFAAGFNSVLVLGGAAHYYQSASRQDTAAIILVNMVIYVGFAFCFFVGFINPGKTSLRVRLFRELQLSPTGLSMEQILTFYDQRRVIQLRLDRLVQGKQIIKSDNRYFLGGVSLWFIATGVRLTRRLVMGRISQFERREAAPYFGPNRKSFRRQNSRTDSVAEQRQ